MVATATGKLVAVSSSAFDDSEPTGLGLPGPGGLLTASAASSSLAGGAGALAGELLVETPCTDAVDVAAHPMRPEVYVLGAGEGGWVGYVRGGGRLGRWQ